ncbi:asparagine synthase (glutamine-hydrolyzing) [Rhodopirellula sallentina]|uniref:asparagine synthase (glutamine-hydrolyzing) n=1 Tax=Rhodopirellula sallentina SM41 TaxID=1263870 RepID=M5UGE4_9BACT|nr:asparagine synthase (glutamine-hydrolyzing) [Rhodopirellula sallentina]EMI56911.1 asparagine synthase (glutamine-hydrolyzing) [Rhodopirellula sallentina SM41]
MCGISGYVWTPAAKSPSMVQFDRMTDQLVHRGPDGRGVHFIRHDDGSGIAIGHRRLSIIDLGTGRQPMTNEDESVWITFNGEIYNYRELRENLIARGHQFKTQSDTETIVHLYEEFGDGCVNYLRGMFAFAIWDDRKRRLLLARDRMGQKPLVYHRSDDRVIFGSEIKAVMASGDVAEDIRPQAIDEYFLYGYIPHPGTIYRDVEKLPPAHVATWQAGQWQVRRYWSPEQSPDSSAPRETLIEEVRQSLNEAVRLRLRSDVPLGAFLSGGIDSTIITGCMQQQSESQVQTYSIGFPDPRYDESEFAREAAEHLQTKHQCMMVEPHSLDVLDTLVRHFDEPFSDSSAVPTFYLSELTRRHVTVAMTGDGGDELFCGYDRYPTADGLASFDRLPKLVRRLLTGPWVNLIPGQSERSWGRRTRQRLQTFGLPMERRYLNWATGSPPAMRSRLYRDDFAALIDGEVSERFISTLMAGTKKLQPGLGAMRTDVGSYLPCDLLAKVDITSMASSLECRSPFLDHHVVEAAYKIPFSQLYQPGQVKPFLTECFDQHLTDRLRNRPKMGFSVPLDRWFRNGLRDRARDLLLAANSRCQVYLDSNAIEKMLDEHESGHWNHGSRIWSLLFLESWARSALEINT